MPLSKRKEVKAFVHKKLLFRLRRLAIVFLIIISLLIYEISQNYIASYIAIDGFLAGIILGLIVSRYMHVISWDAETSKAVTRMDKLGVTVLIFYLLFAVGRRWIFSHFFAGYALSAITLSVSSGAMLGRIYYTRTKIREILKEEGFLHPPKDKNK